MSEKTNENEKEKAKFKASACHPCVQQQISKSQMRGGQLVFSWLWRLPDPESAPLISRNTVRTSSLWLVNTDDVTAKKGIVISILYCLIKTSRSNPSRFFICSSVHCVESQSFISD